MQPLYCSDSCDFLHHLHSVWFDACLSTGWGRGRAGQCPYAFPLTGLCALRCFVRTQAFGLVSGIQGPTKADVNCALRRLPVCQLPTIRQALGTYSTHLACAFKIQVQLSCHACVVQSVLARICACRCTSPKQASSLSDRDTAQALVLDH